MGDKVEMSTRVTFVVDGKPVPKGRPRFNKMTGKIYTPAATVRAEKNIRWNIFQQCASQQNHYKDYTGMVNVTIMFWMPFPSHLRKKEKIEGEGRPIIIRPDLDNLIKLVLDAMNGFMYKDDNQVSGIEAVKLQSANPRTFVEVSYRE